MGRVDRTGESGAIVPIGDDTGFLPYGQSAEYVTEGDRVAIQVIDPEPPWTVGRRPVVSTRPHVPGTYIDLVRETDRRPIDAPNRELKGLVELLDPDLPDGWTVDVSGTASSVELAVLQAELDRLAARCEAVERALETVADPDDPGGIYVPESTVWCRLGRAGQFELGDYRARVTTTVEGHHRLKVGDSAAGRAVDYLEGLDVDVAFNPGAVFDSFGPNVGDRVRIHHSKPTGETIVLGRGEVIDRPQRDAITVRRELSAGGELDALGVPKEEGDVAETTFVEGRRWAPTVYWDDAGNRKGTYINIGTPIEVLPDTVVYIDLYVDVIKHSDGQVAVVDRDELDTAVSEGIVSDSIAETANRLASSLERSIENES